MTVSIPIGDSVTKVGEPDGEDDRSTTRAWIVAGLLFLVGIFSAADRSLPFLLTDPIKATFSASDTQMGLLTGFSFSISLAIFALPLSWIADRYNRAWLIAVSTAVWCAATVACGFATDFWTLFIFRMGVGLGEAALQPAAYSLLADLFPSRKLPKALALMALASVLGNVAALAGGGAVYEHFKTVPLDVSVFGQIEPWRATMAAFGFAGLILALLAFFLIKDPRADTSSVTDQQVYRPPFLPYLRGSAFFFVPFVGSMCAYLMYFEGMSAWTAPFFSRTFDWSIGDIGKAVGAVGLVAGILGLPLGVWLNRFVERRAGREAPVAAICICLVVSLPFLTLAPLLSTGSMALAGFSVVWLFAGAGSVIAPLVLTLTSPPQLRARMIAVCNLIYRTAGAFGPVLFGGFTDRIIRDPDKLYLTISLLPLVLIAACIPPLIYADRRYMKVRRLAEAASG